MDQLPGSFPPPPDSGPPSGYFYQQTPTGIYPLDLGRTFSIAWSMFRFRFWTFAAIALVVTLPVILLVALTQFVAGDVSLDIALQMQTMLRGGTPQIPGSLWPFMALSFLVGALYGIVLQIAGVGTTKAALDTYGGGRAAVGPSIRFAFQRLTTIVAVGLITLAVTILIILAGVTLATVVLLALGSGNRLVPGPGVFLWLLIFVSTFAVLVFVAVRWVLAVPVIAVEGLGAVDALRRSWRLVSGSSWRVLGYLVTFSIAVGLIGAIVTFPASLIVTFTSFSSIRSFPPPTNFVPTIDPALTTLLTLITSVVSVVLAPLVAIGMTLLYFDLRFRKGEQVPQPGSASTATPPPEQMGPPTF